MKERRIIQFSGRVQGVGFRMTAVQLSEGLELTGAVRDLDDGGVELVAEGESAEIDKIITRLREHFGAFIRNIAQRSCAPAGLPGRGIRVVH